MSDAYIVLVPEDPYFTPRAAQLEAALRLVKSWTEGRSDSMCVVKVLKSKLPTFHSCFSNFESVYCPACGAEQTMDWWQQRMDADFDGRYVRTFSRFAMPCCGVETDLNSLRYDFPQAFGRFAISCMNPDMTRFGRRRLREIERVLGCRLRQVLAHL